MEKAIVDWVDIRDENIYRALIKRIDNSCKTYPSPYIKLTIIQKILKSLNKEEQDIVTLYFYEGYSLRKIAKMYNTNHLFIRRKLKEIIEKMRELFYAKIDVLQE